MASGADCRTATSSRSVSVSTQQASQAYQSTHGSEDVQPASATVEVVVKKHLI